MILWAAVALAAATVLSSCAPSRPAPGGWVGKPYTINGVRYQPRAEPNYDRTGIASWYGNRFHGRPTASGERFDQYAMTAAHTTLPLGTRVRVTNLENGRSLLLRINDRGPFVRGRIIDVSRGAAARLGFQRKGLARVRVQIAARSSAERRSVRADPAAQRNAGGDATFDTAVTRFQRDLESVGRKLDRLFE